MNNKVTMFFTYMWNNWNMAECDKAFGPEGAHAWSKYCQFYHVYGSHGAISAFYASLSDRYREMLVERAVSVCEKLYVKEV